MKRNLVLFSTTLLLAACTPTPNSSSTPDSIETSSSISSSSVAPSTSLTPIQQDQKKLDDYAAALASIDGHAKKATVRVETHDYFPLEMETVDEFTTEVFRREGGKSNVLVRKGTITLNGSSDKTTYEMQMFAQDGSIYQLTKASDDTPKQNFVEDTAAGRTIELSLSLAAKQADNFRFLKSVMDLQGVGYTIELGDIPTGDGSFDFYYDMTSYVVENNVVTSTKDEVIKHELSVTKEKGVIASYEYAYELDQYYGGQNVNSKVSFTSAALEQGEYDLFSAELWDPSEFRAS